MVGTAVWRWAGPLAALVVLAATVVPVPALAQTVLAGPRLEQNCDAPIIYSFQYLPTGEPAAVDTAVSTVGDDCTLHAATALEPGEAADGPGTWYWAELPEDRPRSLVLGFHDVSAGTIGWVQLRNTSESWLYRTNASEEWEPLYNLNRRVLSWGPVSIALYNPPSEGDWSPLDIWYRFAFAAAAAADPTADPIEEAPPATLPVDPSVPGS